jgi:hypothetical protein
MQPHDSPLLSVPIEILERIALEVALLQPLGPPADLIPLLCTCKYMRDLFSFRSPNASHFYAKIFRGMFDVDAARRRFGRRALRPHFLALQLKTYCTALRRIRRGDIFAPDIEDLLRIAFILMTENDGKNRAQLEWANAYAFVNSFVRQRLWQDAINGWPRDTPLHSLALWVMWCMTDQGALPSISSSAPPFLADLSPDVLDRESQDDRNDLVTSVLPYVVMAFKVCCCLSLSYPPHKSHVL